MAGRSPFEIRLSDDERAELERRAGSRSAPRWRVLRARLVLMAAEGRSNTEIASVLGISRESASRWRKRFYERRLAGLDERRRPGRPRGRTRDG